MQPASSKQRGFTLVELSIALVIVGLLIGGILVGQSLIHNAKSKRLLSEINSYVVMWNLFKEKYKQIPGDSNLFPTPGNNDKIISNSEATLTMNHLSYAGFLKNGPWTVTNSTGPVVIGTNYPASKIFPTGGYIIVGDAFYNWGNIPIGKMYKIHLSAGGVSGNPGTMRTAFLNMEYAWYIDEKIDDSAPYSGNIVAPNPYSTYRSASSTDTTYLIMWIIEW